MISNREGREWLLKQLHDKGIKYIVYLGDIFGYVGVEKKTGATRRWFHIIA